MTLTKKDDSVQATGRLPFSKSSEFIIPSSVLIEKKSSRATPQRKAGIQNWT